MSDPRPEELIHAEELLYDGKVEDNLSSKQKLFSMILKGKLYASMHEFRKAIKIGEVAYTLSQDFEMIPETIETLILQAFKVFLWKFDGSRDIISRAEKLLESLPKGTTSAFSRLNYQILYLKSLFNWNMGNYDIAFQLVLKSLNLAEKIDNRIDIGMFLQTLSIFSMFVDPESTFEYALRSLTHLEGISYEYGITLSLSLIGGVYYLKGDFEGALEYLYKSLSAKRVSNYSKCSSLLVLGHIFLEKGELDKALDYYNRGTELSGKVEGTNFPNFILRTGMTYRMMGNRELAIKFLKRGESLPGAQLYKILSLFSLFHIYIESETIDQAQHYLASLKEIADQTQLKLVTQLHLLAKALMFQKRGLSRNRAEAERLLKEIINGEIFHFQYYILSLVSLCDFLLEELQEYNDPVLLEEINPLISRLLQVADNSNSHFYFSEAKLLQAKLALIQMNIEEAQYLLTEAQNSADSHGLNLLAQKISSEHDNLLEKVDEWDKLKKEDSSMADRIELASFDGVLNRLQGKQAVEPPELVNEEPILLLIMDNSGTTYFNHPFMKNWDHSDLFSSFMSAFNTFSSEIFSKSIDRIRIGDNTILINPVEEFLTCYVIKGQSYPALKKLARFTKAIRKNSEIWQALNKSLKTSEILEIDSPPALKTVINEIFIK
jgi:tetratricopeptide (TPR) repeat protein